MSIRIPGCGDVDLTFPLMIEPVVRHPLFQLLQYKRQLGLSVMVFPGATHTRFEHSLGAYARTIRIASAWLVRKHIDAEELTHLALYALLHDVGHPPLSHTLEPFLMENHHELGKRAIREMAPEIARCGSSADMLISFLENEHPLACVVSDKHLGIEKLDYLWRDAYHVGYGGSPEIDAIASNLIPQNGKLYLLKRAFEEASELVRFYQKMYHRVYYTARTRYAARLAQKMYVRLREINAIDEASLRLMTDDEFLGRCGTKGDELLERLYIDYKAARLPHTGVIFCRHEYQETHIRRDKRHQWVEGVEDDEFDQLSAAITWTTAHRFEEKVARLLHVSPGAVYVLPIENPKRFGLPTINLLDNDDIIPLTAAAPDLASLTEAAKRTSAIRIGVNDPAALDILVRRRLEILGIFVQQTQEAPA